jgi:GNAT superfamily N-acetyltransferase
MAETIICRRGEPKDHADITRFQVAMALETENLRLDPETCSQGVRAVFDRPHLGQYFVCVKAARVVGSLLIIPEWSDWRNGMVWWIHSVFVTPEERGSGIFRTLYDHVRSLVEQDPGLRGLRLYVDKTNLSAQKVYTKIGMSDEHYLLYEWMKTF